MPRSNTSAIILEYFSLLNAMKEIIGANSPMSNLFFIIFL